MPRMKDLDISFISLVNKGANKQTVKIYKSNDKPLNNDDEFRGFFNVLKSFFNKEKKEENIIKSTYVTDFNILVGEKMIEERIREARWALMDTLENILLEPTIIDKGSYMATQIDSFKTYILNTINTVGVQKSIEQIQQIKKDKENKDMKEEDITKLVNDALTPLKEEIQILKGIDKSQEENDSTDNNNITQDEMIKKAIQEALNPIKDELIELKKSRKISQSLTQNNNNEELIKKSYISSFENIFN